MKKLIEQFKRLPLPLQIAAGVFLGLVVLALIVGIARNVMKSSTSQPSQIVVQQAQNAPQAIIPRPADPTPAVAPPASPGASAPAVAPPAIMSAAALGLDAQMTEKSVSRALFVRTENKPEIEIERSVLTRTSFNVDTDSPAIAAAARGVYGTWIGARFVAFVKVERDEKIAISVTTEGESEHNVALRVNDRKASQTQQRSMWQSGVYSAALLTEEIFAAGYHKIELEIDQYQRKPVALRVAIKPESEPVFRDIVPFSPAPEPAAAAPAAPAAPATAPGAPGATK